jgi:hypothetical protein
MKKINLQVIAVCILLTSFTMSSFGQTASKPMKEHVKKKTKLEKNKVPKEVTEVFYIEYPATVDESWYGYPTIDEKVYWYDNDSSLYSDEYIEYYVVDFTKENTPYKAVYSKKGKKIATHKKVTSDLPKAVLTAINAGEYKDWKIDGDKEEIFKDKDSDVMKVYKVTVEKGKEKHILFFQPDGKLLKDKNCHK